MHPFPCLIKTSYGVLASEYHRWCLELEKVAEKKKRSLSDERGFYNCPSINSKPPLCSDTDRPYPPCSDQWLRVVLDEAHNIKSRTTKSAKACYAIESERRWCLTGTPIQNRLEDLHSLLHFLRLEPWGDISYFRSFITVPFSNKVSVD